MPAKALAFRLVTAALSLSISGLVAFQIYNWHQLTRPIYLVPNDELDTAHRYLYDKHLGWVNVPRLEATTFGKTLKINSKGLRNTREYDYEKPPGTKRIMVLGDSFAWGYGVSNDDMFTNVLEKQLLESGKRWEVLNSAVSGWGTDQEYLFLKKEGFKYHPDLVLLAFFSGNDFQNNVFSRQYGLSKPVFSDLDLTLANSPVPRPGENAPMSKTGLFAPEITRAIVDRMARDCSSVGCTLVVMQFGLDYWGRTRSVFRREWLTANNAYYFNLDEKFAKHGISQDDWLDLDHFHWNEFGHAQTATFLRKFLSQNGLL